MAAFNFPNSPSTDDLHTENGVTYKWNGTVWKRQNASYTDATNLNVTGIATFANNVSIGGTLTYEDVKNVDSVGVITARAGIVAQDDVTFTGATSGRDIVWDKSADELKVKDNTKISFGTDRDLQLSHNNSDSVISHIGSATGNLKILSGGAQSIECVKAGAVNIAHNGSTKLATTSTGVTVTGIGTFSGNIIGGGEIQALTKFESKSGNDLRLNAGSANRDIFLQVNDSTLMTVQGSTSNVGIGTNNPLSLLDVWGANGAGQIRLVETNHTNGNRYGKVLEYAGNLYFQSRNDSSDGGFVFRGEDASATDEFLRITSDGKVGIGIAAPDSLLHVHNGSAGSIAATSYANLTIESSDSDYNVLQFLSPATAAQQVRFGDAADNGAGWIQYNHANNSLSFGANGPERLRIDSTGRLLIGTTTEGNESADELTVASSGNTGITIRSGTTSNASLFFSDATSGADEYRGFVQYIQSDDVLKFGTATNERLRITSTGELIQYANIGAADGAADDLVIGNTTGGVNRGMTIYSNSSQNGSIAFADNNSNFRGAVQYMHNGDRFRFLTGGQETLRLQSGGTDGQCTFFMGGVTNNNNKYGALTLNHYTYNSYNQIDLIKGSSTSGSNLIEIGGSGQSANTSAATTIKFFTAANATTNNGTERLRIASDGKVHFGSHASVGANGYILKEISGDYKFNIFASSSTTTNRIITFNSRSNVEAMRIDANGNIGINKTAPGASLHIGGPSEIRLDNAADAGNYARIRCFEQSSDNGAHLAFSTGAGEVVRFQNDGKVGIGEDSPTRRLHIASDDDLTTFTGGNYGTLAIENNQWDNGEYTAIDFMYNGSAKAVSRIASKIASSGASLHFGVSNNYGTGITHETLVLDYMGDMKGGINPNASLWDAGSENGWYYNRAGGSFQCATPANTGYSSWYINKNTGNGGSSDRRYVEFYWNSGHVGRISENGSGGTSYGTSSDYRRKENLAPITDGITEVKKLKPYRFNFKTCDASNINQGFLAHEAQEVVPHAVSGTKDGMKIDERGDNVPDYQDVDYGQLTPILTAALQEAIAEIETLKAEVAALKSA